ncbi:tannase/feruloyl esterase family alpha/beta hydrolase [Pseudoroseicyclus sp. CXY001]|uniref:tannase/feruloyl esterase family alpha/beta hydrolase n=1 Tax=Pseudoroseicyclus sp. CXY001 TaxID=3242492 RepID=UPI003570EFFF
MFRSLKGALLAGAATLLGQAAFAEALPCDESLAGALGLAEGTRVTAVAHIDAGGEMPVAHCQVSLVTAERTGADGQDYAIRFELRLPDEWNGSFVHQFNGGNDGAVVPAMGGLLGADTSDTALSRGYAVTSSDAGHDGTAQEETAGLAAGNRFGLDPEARRNYGYGAVATVDPLARQVVEAFYGAGIDKAYGIGGSNGGRHAMIAAARMPEAFDGLLIGYPGFNLPQAAVQHAWDVQSVKPVTGDIRTAFAPEDLALVSDAILAACDGLDGLEDGIVGDSAACQGAFDLAAVQCEAGANEGCLSEAQVTALGRMFEGPTNSAGEPLYTNWAWDTGLSSGDWRFWKLESPIPPWGNMPLIAVMGAGSLSYIFTTPPTEVGGSPEELEAYLLGFDFDEDAPKIYASDETFGESAMEAMTPPGADDPELAAFRDAGGKMIIVHGVSDPVFSVLDTISWYEALDANNGDAAEDFAMLYTVPGMPHGTGAASTGDFDLMSALEAWVEEGTAPGPIAAATLAGSEAEATLGAISRPLCPWPQVARYEGGDEASADSFTCE